MSISFGWKVMCASVLTAVLLGGATLVAQQSSSTNDTAQEQENGASQEQEEQQENANRSTSSRQSSQSSSSRNSDDARENDSSKDRANSSSSERTNRSGSRAQRGESDTTRTRSNQDDQFRFNESSTREDSDFSRRENRNRYDEGYRPQPPHERDFEDEPNSGTLRGSYDENRDNERRSNSQDDDTMNRRERNFDRDDRDEYGDRRWDDRDRHNSLGLSVDVDNSDRVIVRDTYSRGLFGRTGIRQGDIIVSVGGQPIRSRNALMNYVYGYRGRGQLPIVILRDGSRQTIYVNPETEYYGDDAPELYAWEDEESAWLGVYLNSRYSNSAVVQGVQEGSAADRAGLRANDWIVSVNGQRIMSPRHLSQVIRDMQPGDRIDMNVSRRVTGQLQATLSERSESGQSRSTRSRPERQVGYED